MNPKITYAPEWIAKILSGQKTMTIRRTQYPCGVYDVVGEAEPDKVVCQIEIVKVEKWEHKKRIPLNNDAVWFFTDARNSGFENLQDFYEYHRENYAPVKYAHTFELVKGDNV